MTRRDFVRPIIARVIRDVGTTDRKALRAALLDAYPFGERAHHPYRIWISEIRYQLGEKPRARTKAPPAPNQQELF